MGLLFLFENTINFINAQVFDDPGNSATKILNTPGIVPVNNSTPGTLTNTLTVAECDTSTGTCSVTFPALDSSIFDGLILSVYDIASSASGNAVTVHPSAGTQIEVTQACARSATTLSPSNRTRESCRSPIRASIGLPRCSSRPR